MENDSLIDSIRAQTDKGSSNSPEISAATIQSSGDRTGSRFFSLPSGSLQVEAEVPVYDTAPPRPSGPIAATTMNHREGTPLSSENQAREYLDSKFTPLFYKPNLWQMEWPKIPLNASPLTHFINQRPLALRNHMYHHIFEVLTTLITQHPLLTFKL